MSFDKFITNMQSMFNGFEYKDELLTEVHNIRLLFQKFQISILDQVKNSLQVSYKLDQDKSAMF